MESYQKEEVRCLKRGHARRKSSLGVGPRKDPKSVKKRLRCHQPQHWGSGAHDQYRCFEIGLRLKS